GTVTVGGNASFTTQGSNDDINLGTLAVTGTIAANTTGATGDATLVNATAVNLAASTIGGNLAVTGTLGSMTDSGLVTVGGTGAFTTSANNASITLDSLAVAGQMTPTTTGAGANVTLVNATGVNIGAWTVGGNLSVTAATGNITDSGTVTVG